MVIFYALTRQNIYKGSRKQRAEFLGAMIRGKIAIYIRKTTSFSHRHSAVRLVDGPRAGVDHRPAGPVQVIAELRIALVHVRRQRVTA